MKITFGAKRTCLIDSRSPRKCGEEKRKEKKLAGTRKSSRVTFGKNLKMRAKDGRIEEGHYLRERAAPGRRAVAWGMSAYAGSRDSAAGAVLWWEPIASAAY